MRLRLLSALAFVMAFGALTAQEAPEKVTSVEGITEYKLENGLKVLLFPDNSVPNITGYSRRAHRTWCAPQRHYLVRPDKLLRNLRRQRRKPRLGP